MISSIIIKSLCSTLSLQKQFSIFWKKILTSFSIIKWHYMVVCVLPFINRIGDNTVNILAFKKWYSRGLGEKKVVKFCKSICCFFINATKNIKKSHWTFIHYNGRLNWAKEVYNLKFVNVTNTQIFFFCYLISLKWVMYVNTSV